MISVAILMILGLLVGGLPGLVIGGALAWLAGRRHSKDPLPPSPRLVMMLLLVELRSGVSVLAALQRTSQRLSGHRELRRVARVATVSGLASSLGEAGPDLRPLVAQLARAQRSGASLTAAVRRMLEQDLATERAEKISRARTLPVRLMIPVTLQMLPGLVLLLYAPALIRTFDQLTGVWS